jgi:hypothetical protein
MQGVRRARRLGSRQRLALQRLRLVGLDHHLCGMRLHGALIALLVGGGGGRLEWPVRRRTERWDYAAA